MEVDAVVVGGGPSGLAAALWLARYRRSVVVLDSGEYRAAKVETSHGYLGRDPQRPLDLLQKGRDELLAYPTASIEQVKANEVEQVDGRFRIAGHTAHRLVLACGVEDDFPVVEGFGGYYGASLFHCPSCDGYEARDRDVVVLGWDPHLVGFSAALLNWARSVTVVTAGRRFRGDDACRAQFEELGIELIEDTAVALRGTRGDLQAVCLGSGREVPTSIGFFSVAHRPRTALAESLGCALDDEGYLVIDECGTTTVPGVYAAGDLTPNLQLVQVAAATGAVAGVAAAQSFFGTPGAPTSPEPAPLALEDGDSLAEHRA